MSRQVTAVILHETYRQELEQWVRTRRTPQQVTPRCQIVLGPAQGRQDKVIAADWEINFKTVARWRSRFSQQGPECLWEAAPGRGRKPRYAASKIKTIIDATRQTRPEGAPHWSCRSLAKKQGVSKATILRIWQSHHLQPHRNQNFKLSRDVRFLEKLTDVVGLYLKPPQKALILGVDEKSQIQALDRTQPGLPLKKGRCGTPTHDYKRHGATGLFAALEIARGKVVGQCYARHRHQEFLHFLKCLDGEFPRELDLHMVMDN